MAAAVVLMAACGGDDDDNVDAAAPPPDAGTPDVAKLPVEWPDSPDDYVGEISTFITGIEFPEIVDGVPLCCKDFGSISRDNIEDGTDNLDNAFARLAVSLGDTVDFQKQINEAAQDGSLLLLLDHRGLDGDPDDFVIVAPFGAFAMGTNYMKAADGRGEFLLLRNSFVEGTGTPNNVFNPSSVANTVATGGPARYTMMLPFGATMIPFLVSAAQIDGTLEFDADGASYMNATVSGYFLLSDVWGAFNDMLARPECACLGLTGPLYVEIAPGVWDGNCVPDAEVLCAEATSSTCVTFADTHLADGICGVGPAIFAAMADIDLDDDPDLYEAVSVGFSWNAVPAKIVGVEPAE